MSILTIDYSKLQYHLSMRATSSQSNEDTRVLQRDHMLRLLYAKRSFSARYFFCRRATYSSRSLQIFSAGITVTGSLHKKQALYIIRCGFTAMVISRPGKRSVTVLDTWTTAGAMKCRPMNSVVQPNQLYFRDYTSVYRPAVSILFVIVYYAI